MRFFVPFFVLLWPAFGFAQVVVNPAALQQLAGIAPPPPVVEVPVMKPAVHHWIYRKAVMMKSRHVPAAVPRAPVVVPVVVPVVAPVVAKPALAPARPAAPAAIVLIFATGSAALPAGAAAALKPACAGGGFAAIDAYAATEASDPSAAMRLSLSRAFAIRDALTACGVPAGRIIPRADGAALGANTATAKVTLSGTAH